MSTQDQSTGVIEVTQDAAPVAPQGERSNRDSFKSAFRAWLYLIWFAILRQARLRQMVWIALGLLALTATLTAINTAFGRWDMGNRRWSWSPRPRVALPQWMAGGLATPANSGKVDAKLAVSLQPEPIVVVTYGQMADGLELLPHLLPGPAAAHAVETALAGGARRALKQTEFYIFSNVIVFSVFVGFLLPIWSLSFATESLGGDRESGSLVWLLTRPLPRPAVYAAKYIALLPWSLGLNLVGFLAICLVSDGPGRLGLIRYWPAVLGATLAYCALFHFLAACFNRAAVVALVYAFFLETIVGSMPGYMKRLSLSFYTRCLMFEAAGEYNVHPDRPSIYLPVDAAAAWTILLIVTVVFLCLGAAVFARKQYHHLG